MVVALTSVPSPSPSPSSEFEKKLERSKRKLERGYAAHQESKKRAKFIDFQVAPIKRKYKEEEFLLPAGPTTTMKPLEAAGTHGREDITEAGTTAPVPEAAQAKAPSSSPVKKREPPRWWIRLKKERDEARIRSLIHSEIREQQQRRRRQYQL
ncbi:unnamed protein product [Linum trigynum]|uniref:Uncharacterized protein n=1 Tax=Linum trigynum TaxID=586398 RepID=A0AAV2E9X1_9ROSI